MYRKHLGEKEGMLFVYNEERILSFWMKNTLIPLDIIFIDKGNIIVDIKTMLPCENNPCPSYASDKPAMYALEINAGAAEKFNISAGDNIEIK